MKPKLHIVSSGSYSDYTIEAILEQQPDKDFDALVQQYEEHCRAKMPPEPENDGEWWDWREAVRRDVWGESTREAGLVRWLKENHGYVEYEFDDKNV